MVERLYIAPERMGSRIELRGEEVHHLLHVKRCRRGDRVEVFTGDGFQYRSTVVDIGPRGLSLVVEGRAPSGMECPVTLRVASAVPRGKRMAVLVEKLTELGVAELIPVDTARSVVRASSVSRSRREHWQRIATQAARQCGRATVMALWGSDEAALRLVAAWAPRARPLWSVLGDEEVGDVTLVIGPEGGFEEEELSGLVDAGFRPVRLGPTVLRVETAGIAAAAAVVLWASGRGRAGHGVAEAGAARQ